jgi:hypothetical protein
VTAEQVTIPNDGTKLYISLYVNNDSEIKLLLSKHPEISRYAIGNHYNVYKKSNPLTKSRFANILAPSAFVQKANGAVIWASDRNCILPWRQNHRNKDEQKEEPIKEEDQKEEPVPVAPVEEPMNPLVYVGLAAAGLAFGVGSKFYQELKS